MDLQALSGKTRRKKSGTWGWGILTVFVLAWDYEVALRLQGETLSSAFLRGSRHPFTRIPIFAGWLLLTGHLFGYLPSKYDPILLIARRVER